MHGPARGFAAVSGTNRGGVRSSELIREAVAVTRSIWGTPPALGMVTFVDPTKVRPKRDFGWCYLKAGFQRCGTTKGGLIALQLLPAGMPEPEEARDFQLKFDLAVGHCG